MLKIHMQGHAEAAPWSAGEPLPKAAQWLDLLDPTEAERAAVEKLLDVRLPQREAISGLGLPRRRHQNDRVLCLHARLYADHVSERSTPLGMLVTHEHLVTLRYAPSRAVSKALAQLRKDDDPLEGPDLLALLFEAIVNDVAEQMQRIGSDVGDLSDDVFTAQRERSSVLRDKLLRIGHLEGRLGRFRTSLLGIGRVTGFVVNRVPEWFDDEATGCLKVVANDLKTLDEFDDQLTGKLQFLQDAVLGFISTDQNAVMKLLTVASVVTIPPVILAGIWGMNFKYMPELSLPWGYPMALAALAISIIVPLLLFAARGWLSRD